MMDTHMTPTRPPPDPDPAQPVSHPRPALAPWRAPIGLGMEREGVRGGLRAVSGWCGFVWCLRAGWDGYYYTGSVGMARARTGENFGRVAEWQIE